MLVAGALTVFGAERVHSRRTAAPQNEIT